MHKNSKSDSYAAAGVDVTAGYQVVDKIKPLVQSTYIDGVLGGIGDFGGQFAPNLTGMTRPILVSGTDGFDLLVAHLILFCLKRFVYAHCDVGRLLINRRDDTTRVCIETIFSSRVADLTDRITDDLLNIDISLCRNLTHNKYKTGRGRCLTCNTAHRILLKQCIKNRI